MVQADTKKARPWYIPRFPLEMTIASLATLLATTIYFDLPHRLPVTVPAEPPVAEKLTLQAQPLPMQLSSADADASRFMEAVALSHVAPPLPQTQIDQPSMDRAAARPVEPPPPPAVQVLARNPLHDRVKPVATSLPPLPPARTAQPVSRPAAAPAPIVATAQATGTEPRPPGAIPVGARPADKRGGVHVPVVSDVANMAGSAISSGVDSIGRGIDWMMPRR